MTVRRVRLFFFLVPFMSALANSETDPATGLVIAPGFDLVKVQCTVCHSAALITQSRASREGWLAMIRWMQESQGLWPLGANEAPILDYLATHYPPSSSGRRRPLAAALLPPP
jgi:hypothetical protein